MKKTTELIILCIIGSLVCWYIDDGSILRFSGASSFQGRFWVVFTALFIHGNLMHLAGNMLFLYVFGGTLKDEIGAGKTISVFFIGGILSFILSTFFYGSYTFMIGSSAAIFTQQSLLCSLSLLSSLGYFLCFYA